MLVDVKCIVGSIKGLRQFGQDELAPVGDLGSNDAGTVAPIEFADGYLGRERIALGSGRGFLGKSTLVAAPLATQTTIGVTRGLLPG